MAASAQLSSAQAEDGGPDFDLPGVEPTLTEEKIEQSLGRELDSQGNWIDTSHAYIGSRADDLAIYLDTFFGAPLEDLESADSTVRLSTGYEYDQDRGSDIRLRLRGNLHLPRINERLSLVFNGEDDEEDGGFATGDRENEAGLQFRASDEERTRSRLDFTLSFSSGVNLKPGIRYRYKDELGDKGRFRYTGRAFYSDKERFHHRHWVDFDYQTGETSLLRWSTRFKRGEVSEGTEWRTALNWRYGYSLDSAAAISLFISGKTDPDAPDEVGPGTKWPAEPFDDGSLVTNYGVVLRFRNRLYKDWLFVEFEPGYTQRKRNHYDERHGVFFARVNFEIIFNRGRESVIGSETPESGPPVAEVAPS
ncbi:MAG: hypothetical protein AAGI11_14035 [Pseudomonadota bacterium]